MLLEPAGRMHRVPRGARPAVPWQMADDRSDLSPPRREPPWWRSLRVRLALVAAAAIAATLVGAAGLALLMARGTLVDEVVEIASRAAGRAVHEVEQIPPPRDPSRVQDALGQIDAAVGEIEGVALVEARSGPAARVVAAAGTPPDDDALLLGRRALEEGRQVVEREGGVVRAATPLGRAGGPAREAIVLRANFDAVLGLQARAVQAVAGFGVIAIVALVLLLDVVAGQLVYRPIRQIRDTIARVSAGDLAARAPVARRDELGEVALGLNEMLARLEHFNEAMQARIAEATGELQRRNQQLIESYNRLIGLREQLASAEQLASVGQTAANVAHQVGTPLNLISGYVQLLKEEIGPDSPHLARLAIIEEQISKVTATVRTLLDRSRRMGRKTRTTAGALVERVVEVMQPNLQAAGIAYEVDLAAGDVPILVDATNLELALLNLVTNAVDAMPNGGQLRIRVYDGSPNRVRIEIADTGHGIAEDLLPRIFEPWVSTKTPGRGTGLGLAIARDVVTAHGGTVTVTSQVGVGTAFTIDLPSAAPRDAGRIAAS